MTRKPDAFGAGPLQLPDGRRLAWSTYGDPDGFPVFYLHGALSSRLEAEVLDASARELGVRLIGVDRPGIGGSSPVARRTFAGFARDLAALADAIGAGRFGLLGLSAGGPYALTAAAVLRERVTAVVVCAGLAPPGPADLARPRSMRLFLALTRRNWVVAGVFVALIGRLIRARRERFFIEGASTPWDKRAMAIPGMARIQAESWIEGTRQGARAVVEDVRVALRPWDIPLAPLTCPVWLWHGESDSIVPPGSAVFMAQTLKTATLRLVPAQGHNVLVDQRAVVLMPFQQ